MIPLSFPDVTVLPTEAVLGRPLPFEFKGGPLWPDFAAQLEPRHLRGRVPLPFDAAPEPPATPGAFLAEAAWCGPVCHHFGHAVTDFGMRVAASTHGLPGLPLLFSVGPGGAAEIPDFFWGILDQFAVPRDRVRLVAEPVRVGMLHVFPQAERLEGPKADPAHLDLMDRTARRQHDPDLAGAAVFVSRARFRVDSMMGRIAGETYLDAALSAAGVRVIHPELISVAEQVRVYQNAGRLLFSEGSALHGLQLLGRVRARVGVIPRRPKGRMAAAVLAARAAQVSWIDAMDGQIRGLRRDGNGPEVSAGLMVLDPVRLLDALAAELEIDLRPVWDPAAYRAACLADAKAWLRFRPLHRRRLGPCEGDAGAIAESLRAIRLLEGALEPGRAA